MKNLSLLLTALLIPAMVSAQNRIPEPIERIENVSSYFMRPAVGEEKTAEVGETLYQEGIRTVSKRFRATLSAPASSLMDRGYKLDVPVGASGLMLMRGRGGVPLLCFMTKNTGVMGFFGDGNVAGCLADTSRNGTFDKSTFKQYDRFFALAAPVPYQVEVTETAIENHDDFYVDVLYQGTSKGEVKISYREFSAGIARPAFTQDVTYELAPDGTAMIAFKGMRIKVLKATGQNIRYVVDQPMPAMTKYRVPVTQN